jgi:hypothetical protein
MRLHPDLEKLLPDERRRVAATEEPVGRVPRIDLTPEDLTAFALAVARAERERCAAEWSGLHPEDDGAAVLRALPDPDWAVTP